jgi:uncharacterized membrane protein
MRAAHWFTGRVLLVAGILHFVRPQTYEAIMPRYLPAHRELIYASGVTEVATAVGSWHPRTRRAAGWLGILTMAGVFPANVQMALEPERYPAIPRFALFARLPLQALFVAWIWRATLSERANPRD